MDPKLALNLAEGCAWLQGPKNVPKRPFLGHFGPGIASQMKANSDAPDSKYERSVPMLSGFRPQLTLYI